MKRHWIVFSMMALMCFSAVGASVATAQEASPAPEAAPASEAVPASDESCAQGNVCYWNEPEYHGVKNYVPCDTGSHAVYLESAKDRCANKPATFRRNGTFVRCIGPQENDQFSSSVTEIYIGKEGASC